MSLDEAPIHQELEFYVIYWNPSDYPGLFVLRRQTLCWGMIGHANIRDAEPMAVSKHLFDVRAALPGGLHNLGRKLDDDPVIFETWV